MYLIAENLVNHWDVIKDEFKQTKTLKDKHLLIPMMYQPWELCDDTLRQCNRAGYFTVTLLLRIIRMRSQLPWRASGVVFIQTNKHTKVLDEC